ncbi:MAG: hypothetical protein LBT64_02000, partial [Puniceicoccales bacterium]|nr:hypothetical protein [Puniceicoccales bacterium]
CEFFNGIGDCGGLKDNISGTKETFGNAQPVHVESGAQGFSLGQSSGAHTENKALNVRQLEAEGNIGVVEKIFLATAHIAMFLAKFVNWRSAIDSIKSKIDTICDTWKKIAEKYDNYGACLLEKCNGRKSGIKDTIGAFGKCADYNGKAAKFYKLAERSLQYGAMRDAAMAMQKIAELQKDNPQAWENAEKAWEKLIKTEKNVSNDVAKLDHCLEQKQKCSPR